MHLLNENNKNGLLYKVWANLPIFAICNACDDGFLDIQANPCQDSLVVCVGLGYGVGNLGCKLGKFGVFGVVCQKNLPCSYKRSEQGVVLK